ncbi:MAG: MarR family transcriptional regulator [Verrucomicrobiota bacterium]
MSKTGTLEEMHRLANSIRRTYNRLYAVTDVIHADSDLTAPKRTLLLDLHREGALTIPALAKLRCVSRQIIQTQVNELINARLVATKDNPNHKRSFLLVLTSLGERTVQKIIDKESDFIRQLGWFPEADSLAKCQKVLDQIYEKLE